MNLNDQKKRIKEGLKKLNDMEHHVWFSIEETDYSVGVTCASKCNESHRFGAYECTEFFEDYNKKVGAYNTVREFVEGMVAATELTSPSAYHNFIANGGVRC